jgi:hypothetical protein
VNTETKGEIVIFVGLAAFLAFVWLGSRSAGGQGGTLGDLLSSLPAGGSSQGPALVPLETVTIATGAGQPGLASCGCTGTTGPSGTQYAGGGALAAALANSQAFLASLPAFTVPPPAPTAISVPTSQPVPADPTGPAPAVNGAILTFTPQDIQLAIAELNAPYAVARLNAGPIYAQPTPIWA